MKSLVFILLLSISVSIYGQTEKLNDTIHFKKESPKFDEKLDYYLRLDNSDANIKNALPPLEIPKLKEANKAKDIIIPRLDIYQGPPLESNTFTRFPFINDYTFSSGMILSDNLWISTLSRQSEYPTLGGMRTVNMKLNYQPTDWLIISGGPYAAKYNLIYNPNGIGYRQNHYNDIGVNSAIKFILHDRIRLNAYGQYSAYGKGNGIPHMGLYPNTYYGGGIELKITEKFGIEGGVIRELNPFNGKWVNRPYVAPVFYSK